MTEELPPEAPWWAKWLDANARDAWRWASVRWSAFCAAAAEVYAYNPNQVNEWIQKEVPSSWWPHIVALVCLMQLFFRVTKLKKETQQ
jgi:hypothetical protein